MNVVAYRCRNCGYEAGKMWIGCCPKCEGYWIIIRVNPVDGAK